MSQEAKLLRRVLSDLPTYSSSNWTSLRETRLKPRDLVLRLRFLLGKHLFDKCTEEDTVELFSIVFRLGTLTERNFVRKWGFTLTLLLGIRFDKGTQHVTNALGELKRIFPRLLPHSREYFGRKVAQEPALSLQWRQPKRFRPKKFVGVGYDKSTADSPVSWDGSPPWQEVAMDEWFQSHNSQGWQYQSPVDSRSTARHWSG